MLLTLLFQKISEDLISHGLGVIVGICVAIEVNVEVGI